MKENNKKEDIRKCEFKVEGMHCPACELLIEEKLSERSDIISADAKLNDKKLIVETNSEKSDKDLADEFNDLVNEHGYTILDKDGKVEKEADKNNKLLVSLCISLLIIFIFFLISKSGVIDNINLDSTSFAFNFLLGVVASLSSCMATVGGLVLTLSTKFSEGKKVLPIILFHIARLIGFFILGGIVGYAGSLFKLSSLASLILNLLLSIIMIILGLDLLRIFSITSKLQPRLPRVFGKGVIKFSEGTNYIAPILLGALTFFLPCGFTQNRQLAALVSGSFLNGATIMLVFALGTLPALGLISFVSIKFSTSKFANYFFKVAGFLIIFFAIIQLYNALVVAGVIPPIGI